MTREKILLIAGCSHAAGSEIDGSTDSNYNREHSFGSQLALKLEYRPINIAMAGATNSSIVRSVLKWFESTYDPNIMEVAVLVCWTDSTRIEYPRKTPKPTNDLAKAANWYDVSANYFLGINLGFTGNTEEEKEIAKDMHKFILKYPSIMELMSLSYVLQLQYFFKMWGVKYLMCNCMKLFEAADIHLGFYLNSIDRKNFMGLDTPSDAFFIKYKELGYTNPNAKYWHHGQEPHGLYADELFTFARNNECL